MTVILKNRRLKPGILRSLILGVLVVALLLTFAACGESIEDQIRAIAGEGEAEQQLRQQLANGETYEITINGTLYLSDPATVVGNKTIKGDGKIKAIGKWAEDAYLLQVASGTELVLAQTVTVDANGKCGGVYIEEGAALNVTEEATIRDSAEGCAGVYALGQFQQNGGVITDGYNNVYVAPGSLFQWNSGKNLNAANSGIDVAEGAELKVGGIAAVLKDAGHQGIRLAGSATFEDILVTGCAENQIEIEASGVVVINNCTMSGSKGHAITNRGKLSINNCDISNAASCGVVTTGALEVTGGSIRNNGNKGILVRNGGNLLIASESVSVSSNVVGISVEENATADVSKAKINSNSLNNISCFGEIYLHDLMMGGSGSNCIATNYGGHVVAKNVEIISTNGNNGVYNINGSLVELTDVKFSNIKTYAIRNLDADLVGTNITVENSGGTISTGDYLFGKAGSVKIDNITTSGIKGCNIATEAGCGGTIEITNANFGATNSNNLSVKGGKVTLTDVIVDGNSATPDGTVHGILMDHGGSIYATNLTIRNTYASGIRNRGGYFEGRNVQMSGITKDAISNTVHGTTKAPGTVIIYDLLSKGVGENHIDNESKDCNVYIYGGWMSRTVNNCVINRNGTTILSSVELAGTVDKWKDNIHGIMVTAGTVKATDVTIGNVYKASIRMTGGKFIGENITTKGSFQAIYSTGGNVEINGFTTNGVTEQNVYLDSDKASVSIVNGKFCGTTSNNIRIFKGIMSLTDTDITGHSADRPDNETLHGIMISGGELKLDNVHIHDAKNAAVRVKGATVIATDLTATDCTQALNIDSKSVVKVDGITTSNMSNANVEGFASEITVENGILGKVGSGNNLSIKDGGTLSLKNLTVQGTEGASAHGVYVVKGTLNADHVTIQDAASGLRINDDNAVVNVSNSKLTGNRDQGVNQSKGTTVLNNVTVSDNARKGITMDGGSITMTGVTVSGTNDAVNANKGTMTVNGGSISGVVTNGATLNLDGKVIGAVNSAGTLNLTGNVDGVVRNTGKLNLGAAYVGAGVYSENPINYTASTSAHTAQNPMVLTVPDSQIVPGTILVVFSDADTAKALAPSFTVPESYETLVPPSVENPSSLEVYENTLRLYRDMNVYVAVVNGQYKYKTLEEAIAKAVEVSTADTAATVALLADVPMNATVTVDGGNVVITNDGNERTIRREAVFSASRAVLFDVKGGAKLTFSDITIDGNEGFTANGNSAMIVMVNGGKSQVTVDNCKLINNSSTGQGGTIRTEDNGGTLTITGSTFENNKTNGNNGAVISVSSGVMLKVSDSVFTGNTATGNGGAIVILNGGKASIENSTFIGNTAASGGAVYSDCRVITDAVLKNCSITGNTANNGGGVYTPGTGYITLDGCTVTGNTSKNKQGHDVQIAASDNKAHLRVLSSEKADVLNAYFRNRSAMDVDGTLATGSQINVYWYVTNFAANANGHTAVTFDSAATAAANKASITLNGENAAAYYLEYTDAKAVLTAGTAAVAKIGETEYETLDEAIAAAAAASTADSAVTVTLLRDIQLSKIVNIPANANIVITDNGSTRTVTRSAGFNTGRAVMFDILDNAKLTLTGKLVFDGNKANYTANGNAAIIVLKGGANSSLTVSGGVTFQNNTSSGAGGLLRIESGKLTVDGAVFQGQNTINNSAGAINLISTVPATIKNASFLNNTVSAGGAAIMVQNGASATVTDCVFDGNQAGADGGAIVVVSGGKLTADNCQFENNKTTGNGGVLNASGKSKGDIVVKNSTFNNNSANKGGAATVATGFHLSLENCTMSGNKANSEGDDIRLGGGTSRVYLKGKVIAQIHNQNISTVVVEGTLAEGSQVICNWQIGMDRIPEIAVQFDSAEVAAANSYFLALSSSNAETHHLEYKDATAVLAEGGSGVSVAMIGMKSFVTLHDAVAEAAAMSTADKAVTIKLVSDIAQSSIINIPANANIVITDDGTARTITRAANYTMDGTRAVMFDIYSGAKLTLSGKLTIDGNKAGFTATGNSAVVVLKQSNAALSISGVRFVNNTSKGAGGVIRTENNINGKIYIDGAVFDGQYTNANSAGYLYIQNTSYAEIKNSTFSNSSVTGDGGVFMVNSGGKLTVDNCRFEGNKAGGSGGVINASGKNKGDVVFKNSVFSNNSANKGGVATIPTGFMITLENCTMSDNKANSEGNDIRLGGATSKIYLKGKVVTDIHNQNASTVVVEGTLTEGSSICCNWLVNDSARIPGVAVQFDSAEAAAANMAYITVSNSVANAGYQLTLDAAAAKLTKPTAASEELPVPEESGTEAPAEIQ